MKQARTTILLRLFVEVNSIPEAEESRDEVMKAIHPYLKPSRCEINSYWKIPEYYEVICEFAEIDDPNKSFSDILPVLASGWDIHDIGNEKWAVWNPSPNGEFLSSQIRWASLEIVLKHSDCCEPHSDAQRSESGL